jgi:hypothetical protein
MLVSFGDVVHVICRDAWTWARKILPLLSAEVAPACISAVPRKPTLDSPWRPPHGGRWQFGVPEFLVGSRLTPGADIEGPITVGSDQALVSGSLQSFLDTSDKVVRTEWLV